MQRMTDPSENPYASPHEDGPRPRSRGAPSNDGLIWLAFSFRGRIRRSTYWGATLCAFVVYIGVIVGVSVIEGAVARAGPQQLSVTPFIMLPVIGVFYWVLFAVQAKRWHDRDKSGWWLLIQLVPILGPIWGFIEVGCLRGTIGPNRYGDDPTGDGPSGAAVRSLESGELDSALVVDLEETGVTDADLLQLAGNLVMEELRLGGTAVSDAGVRYLARLDTLEFLDLSLTQVTDASIPIIAALPNLTTLWIGGTNVTDAGLAQLVKHSKLREVHAKNSLITAEGRDEFIRQRAGCTVYV